MPQNELNLKRVALVTGAAKRIGAVIAKALHQQGFRVLIHYRHSEQEAKALAASLNHIRPDSAGVLQADLNDTKSYSSLIEKAAAVWKRLDVLVNSASDFFPNQIGETTLEQWNTLWNTNVTAPFFLTQAAVPFLKKQENSVVINITDSHADGRPIKNYSVYSITKAALLMQTQSLARELAPYIRVNAVAPGACFPPENISEDTSKTILERTPLRKIGSGEEVANAVCYLASHATYTTGTTLYVDGGRSIFN